MFGKNLFDFAGQELEKDNIERNENKNDIKNENTNYVKNEKHTNINNNNKPSNDDVLKNKVEDMYEKYKNYNQTDLMAKLCENIENQKNNGTFNPAALKETMERCKPMLNENQKGFLEDLLNKICK